jgi:hypothetical protein
MDMDRPVAGLFGCMLGMVAVKDEVDVDSGFGLVEPGPVLSGVRTTTTLIKLFESPRRTPNLTIVSLLLARASCKCTISCV